jgi:metacaspase-1
MAKGISIHIGLNFLDGQHYQLTDGRPWRGELLGPVSDATGLEALARSQGYQTQLLLNEQATAGNVIQALETAATNLTAGDCLLITFSGHGAQLPDKSGDEKDRKDETWCLYDRMFIDDELYVLWKGFAKDVRILMLSDSCHSGTMAKDLDEAGAAPNTPAINLLPHLLPAKVISGTYHGSEETYNALLTRYPDGDKTNIKATVVLISACREDQVAYDANPMQSPYSQFTNAVLKTWNAGQFKGSLLDFTQAVTSLLARFQTPNIQREGVSNSTFESQPPFLI